MPQNYITISEIKTTRRGREALFVDGEFLFSVDSETLHKQRISTGSSLSRDQLEYLRSQSDARKAKDSALRYLSLRSYGEKELYNKLLQKFDEETCVLVMEDILSLNLINDMDFAFEKANGMSERGKSVKEIKYKLFSLGIRDEIINQAVEGLEEDEFSKAVSLLNRMYSEKLKAGKKQQVMAALARRGFSHSIINSAIEEVLEDL